MLNQVPHALSEGGQVVALDCALKFSINKKGNYEVSFSPSETGSFMNNGTKPYLDSLSKFPGLSQKN